MVYNDLAQFTYGAASTATAAFPITQKESVSVGNLDLYAMDTYKLSQRWTVIAGLRATWNTNPVNRHGLFARPAGSFLDMAHDAAQPLSEAIQTNVRSLFPGTPLFSWQPRASLAYKLSNTMALHAGGGVFNDIIPAQVADLGATNPPYAPVFVGGINGQVGGVGIAPGVANSAVDATAQANQSFQSAFRSNAPSPFAVNLNTFPSGTLKTPYFLEWSLGLERELGARGSLRVDYVGTRAVQEPYQVQLNGYQTVCNGCFAPFAYNQPLDSRFGNVNEFRTGAGSNYAGLQTSATKQFSSLTLRVNYSFSHCLDEVSNGGLLAYSSLGILSPLPGDLRKEYGNCDYDVRHNLTAFAIYEIPFRSSHALLRRALGGWQVSGTAILHSGLPFSVLSAPYTANNHGIFQGSGPQYRESRSGRAAVPQDRRLRRDPARQPAMAQPRRVCFGGRSRHRRVCGRRFACDLPVRQLWPQQLSRTALYLLRGLRDQEDSDHGTCNLPLRHADIQSSSTTRTSPCPRTRPERLASRRRRLALAR